MRYFLIASSGFFILVFMIRNYKFRNLEGLYFVSFSTVYWIDVFVRDRYFSVLFDSVNFCRKEKGMELFCYCFMPSHIHFLFRSNLGDPSGLLRDFKKHTSRQLIKLIKSNIQESRKEWLLWFFNHAAKKSSNVSNFQFWRHDNKPIERN